MSNIEILKACSEYPKAWDGAQESSTKLLFSSGCVYAFELPSKHSVVCRYRVCVLSELKRYYRPCESMEELIVTYIAEVAKNECV